MCLRAVQCFTFTPALLSLPLGIMGMPNICLLSWWETEQEPSLLTFQVLILPTILDVKADTQTEIKRYLAYIADSQGSPTDTIKSLCKRLLKARRLRKPTHMTKQSISFATVVFQYRYGDILGRYRINVKILVSWQHYSWMKFTIPRAPLTTTRVNVPHVDVQATGPHTVRQV